MNAVFRPLLLLLGTLSVGLGVVGIAVPMLPTTPFLLLAAWCYARSSQRFLHWLLANRWFGRYLRDYREGRGVPAREKAVALAMLWITIGLTTGFAVSAWWVRGLLWAIAAGTTIHLVRLKTRRPDRDDACSGDARAESGRPRTAANAGRLAPAAEHEGEPT
jgi:uncharacterized membrane protein YbaN (DUF454 family)